MPTDLSKSLFSSVAETMIAEVADTLLLVTVKVPSVSVVPVKVATPTFAFKVRDVPATELVAAVS